MLISCYNWDGGGGGGKVKRNRYYRCAPSVLNRIAINLGEAVQVCDSYVLAGNAVTCACVRLYPLTRSTPLLQIHPMLFNTYQCRPRDA